MGIYGHMLSRRGKSDVFLHFYDYIGGEERILYIVFVLSSILYILLHICKPSLSSKVDQCLTKLDKSNIIQMSTL